MKQLLLLLLLVPFVGQSQVSYTVTITQLRALADACDGAIPIVCPNAPQDPVFNIWSNDAEANEHHYCWVFNDEPLIEYGLWYDIQNVEIANETNVMTSYINIDMAGFESDAITAPTCDSGVGDDQVMDRQFVHQFLLSDYPPSVPFTSTIALNDVYFAKVEIEWIDLTAGLSNFEKEISFVLAPNPSNGNVLIRLDEQGISEFTVNVSDLSGRIVYSEVVMSNEAQLDLSNQLAGAYFINVQTNNMNTTKRLTINK